MIPVKLDRPEQQEILKRCLSSIRTIYPETPVYIVRAVGTHLTIDLDYNTYIVQNPAFSTFGAMQLFEENRYADTACILHDSMVLLAPLPSPLPDVQFLYHFESPVFEHGLNLEGYRRLVPTETDALLSTLSVGCFGNALLIRHDRLVDIGLKYLYPKITTKYDFECMERILAFKVQRAGYSRPSLCGNILSPTTDPWRHSEYATMSLYQLRALDFPYPILKSCLARK